MNYNFSDKVSSLAPSVIREILKFSSVEGMIPFSAGNPAAEAFPCEAIAEISQDIFTRRPVDALQYSITEGYEPLRKTVSEYMKKRHGIGRDFDNIIITSGAQQVMDLATKSLCNEGDTVICEAPTFIGSLNCFRSYGVRLCGVDMQEDGMDIDALERLLKSEKNVRFIYTIPNFQNPSGITMSAAKRKALYELAKKHGVLIIEDNPYGDLRFAGEHIPAIKSLDEDGIVIYAGSFSKVLSPGLRVGYTIAPAPIVAKMTVCKQTSDVHTNAFAQILTDEFMTCCDFDAHLERLRSIYRRKAQLMMALMDEHFDGKITYAKTEGGLFIWCTLPADTDMLQFCRDAVNEKVAVVPGSAFLVNESDECHDFRTNFSTPTDEQISKGIEILGGMAKKI